MFVFPNFENKAVNIMWIGQIERQRGHNIRGVKLAGPNRFFLKISDFYCRFARTGANSAFIGNKNGQITNK